jgi:PPP family 3-phenylpropionic acid transporter
VSGRLVPLRLYYFASFAALGAYAPFFPRWLEARGVVGLAMGLVAGLVPAMGVLGPPAVGVLADALHARGSLLRVCALGSSLAMAALALAAWTGRASSVGVVFAAVLVYAVFRSPMVMLADVINLEQVRAAGTTYGAIRLWGSLGFLVAALAVGRAVDPQALGALPATVAVLLLAAFVSALPLPARPVPAHLPGAGDARALVVSPSFGPFLIISLLAQVAHSGYDLCFSLHLRDLGATDGTTGAAWALGVVVEIAFMASASRLVARFSAPRLLVAALFGATVRWALLATVYSVPLLLLLQPLHALSFALWWIASLAYLDARAPAHAMATAQGLFTAAVAAGSVIGMVAWGTLYRRSAGSAVFGAATVIALLATLLAARWAASEAEHRP